jgi:hypothetical protein
VEFNSNRRVATAPARRAKMSEAGPDEMRLSLIKGSAVVYFEFLVMAAPSVENAMGGFISAFQAQLFVFSQHRYCLSFSSLT